MHRTQLGLRTVWLLNDGLFHVSAGPAGQRLISILYHERRTSQHISLDISDQPRHLGLGNGSRVNSCCLASASFFLYHAQLTTLSAFGPRTKPIMASVTVARLNHVLRPLIKRPTTTTFWKLVALVLVLLNLKSLPLAWHVRRTRPCPVIPTNVIRYALP